MSNRNFDPRNITERFVGNVYAAWKYLNERKIEFDSEWIVDAIAANESFNPNQFDVKFASRLYENAVSLHRMAKDNREKFEVCLSTVVSQSNDPIATLEGMKKKYTLAKSVVNETFDEKYHSPEVYLNVAYAIDAIGEAKIRALYNSGGIVYFARYTIEVLEEAYSNLEPGNEKSQPVLLAVSARDDHNGAFYTAGRHLDELRAGYRIVLKEVETENQYYDAVKETAESYQKISAHILGGHGQPSAISLGGRSDENRLDLTDYELRNLSVYFVEKPVVVLVSCSTGRDSKAMGGFMSEIWRATLFAPIDPTNVLGYELDDKSMIKNVRFHIETQEFEGGELSNE